MALGGYSVSSGTESLAVGHVAKATGEYNIAMGTNAITANMNSIAIGRDTEAATQGVGEPNTDTPWLSALVRKLTKITLSH